MTPLVPAAGGALLVAAAITAAAGLRPAPERPPAPPRRLPFAARLAATSRRTWTLLGVGAAAGCLIAALTGWLLAVPLVPAVLVGLPALLSPPGSARGIDRLEAMAEWTRALSGVLTVGVGLEQALIATVRSTPPPIRPEVGRLVARLRGRWGTEAALRAFADELDDATGDLIAANLILAARRRGAGLAAVLTALAESVAEDVRARRAIEADRAKPRSTARTVTVITVSVLTVMALNGAYVAPYSTPLGQLVLAVLLSGYVGGLVWVRSMAAFDPLPRFIGAAAKARART